MIENLFLHFSSSKKRRLCSREVLFAQGNPLSPPSPQGQSAQFLTNVSQSLGDFLLPPPQHNFRVLFSLLFLSLSLSLSLSLLSGLCFTAPLINFTQTQNFLAGSQNDISQYICINSFKELNIFRDFKQSPDKSDSRCFLLLPPPIPPKWVCPDFAS